MKSHGTHFIHASDEWYLLAEMDLPEEDNYDGYIQLENGVGMIRLLLDEFRAALLELVATRQDAVKDGESGTWLPDETEKHVVSIAPGRLAAPFIGLLATECMEQFPNYEICVYPIRNDFFGERITVSGLLTGQDIMAQLKGEHLGEELLLPINVLRSGERVLLDDYTVEDISKALQVPVNIVKSSGYDFTESLLGKS